MRSLSEATQRIARGDLRTPIPEDTEFQSPRGTSTAWRAV